MRLTQTHLDYFNERRLPTWSKRIPKHRCAPSIDAVVNAHAGYSDHRAVQVRATLELIRIRRQRFCSCIQAMADLTNCPASPRRQFDVAKWTRRIVRSSPVTQVLPPTEATNRT